MDFRNASRHFADPAFDGRPEVVIELDDDDPVIEPEGETETGDGVDYPDDDGEVIVDPPDPNSGEGEGEDRPRKYYVGDVEVNVISERVQYVDKDGKLITESLIDYTKKSILQQYAKLDDFIRRWSEADKKQAIIEELESEGVLLDAVREELGRDDLDDFDLICHLAFDKAPLTKRERAENVKKRHYLYKYSDVAQNVLESLLDKYADEGIKEIEKTEVLQLDEFTKYGSPIKIVNEFGGKAKYEQAVRELEDEIYLA